MPSEPILDVIRSSYLAPECHANPPLDIMLLGYDLEVPWKPRGSIPPGYYDIAWERQLRRLELTIKAHRDVVPPVLQPGTPFRSLRRRGAESRIIQVIASPRSFILTGADKPHCFGCSGNRSGPAHDNKPDESYLSASRLGCQAPLSGQPACRERGCATSLYNSVLANSNF